MSRVVGGESEGDKDQMTCSVTLPCSDLASGPADGRDVTLAHDAGLVVQVKPKKRKEVRH